MTSVTVIRLAKTLLIVVLSKSICESSLTRPRSAIARVGDKVEFNCSAEPNQQVIWGFTSSNTSKDADFYFGVNISLPFESRYRIDKNISGEHNLIIDSVDLGHAGRYRCVTFGTDSNAAAYLTVLDTVPECWTNITSADQGIKKHGFLWMWCRVIYTGNMIPIFTWTKNNTQDSITTNTTTPDKRTLPLTTTSSVIAQLNADDNGAIFKCNITFQLPNNNKENAPNYEYTWNYTANVTYGPRNLRITRYGDRFECSADGNPTPLYKWTDVETNISTEGPTFMLHDIATSDKNYTLQCTAVNAIATMTKNIAAETVPSLKTSRRINVAAIVGGTAFQLLLLIIIVSCLVNRKKLKGLTTKSRSCFGTDDEPDVVISADFNSHALIETDDCFVADNLVYAEVKRPNGSNTFFLPEPSSEIQQVSSSSETKEKKRKRNNHLNPVYTEVKKKTKESLKDHKIPTFSLQDDDFQSQQSLNQTKKRQNRTGADGTAYVDLGEVRKAVNESNESAVKKQPAAFSRMNYALIDHTGKIPPPPPKF